MLPIAPLMIEHRLIEKLIPRLEIEAMRIRTSWGVDPVFIERAVDFIRTYADRCHHGKEEDILFRELAQKPLTDELSRIMRRLVDDHARARELTQALVEAKGRFQRGDAGAAEEVAALLHRIAEMYPEHIRTEDRQFFMPVMVYFDPDERARLLERFAEFDRQLIHEKYAKLIDELRET